MKINMPNHEIAESNSVSLKDIPLAYIDTESVIQDLDIDVSVDCAKDVITPVRAYDYIEDPEQIFFTSDRKPIEEVSLHRTGNVYSYEPQGMIEYPPQMFEATALVKKKMRYDAKKQYNLRVSVIDGQSKTPLSHNMIKIFGDAYERGVAPSNIKINKGENSIYSLTSGMYSNMDFVFAESKDGVTINAGNSAEIQPKIEKILDTNTNVWLSTDSFGGLYTSGWKENDGKSTVQHVVFDDPQIFQQSSYEQSVDSITIFAAEGTNPSYPPSQYNYERIGRSILILEKKKSGYLIVTPTFILNDLEKNAKLIYEVMMHVFLKSYYRSDTMSSWITNNPIDYAAYYVQKINRRHKMVKLDSLLQNANYEIGQDYELIDVTVRCTPQNAVSFVGINTNGELLFLKTGGAQDPKKAEEAISFLTTKTTVINYRQEDVNIVESKMLLDYNIIDDIAYLTVHPFASSSMRIHTASDQTFRISEANIKYYLCALSTSPEVESMFQVIPFDQYSYNKHGHILAAVILRGKKTTKLYDISIKGGGLPESLEDNYNLIDIGNTYGRPYRVGSTMIIKLPKRYKEYDAYIKNAIVEHMASGDYPVVIYQ